MNHVDSRGVSVCNNLRIIHNLYLDKTGSGRGFNQKFVKLLEKTVLNASIPLIVII